MLNDHISKFKKSQKQENLFLINFRTLRNILDQIWPLLRGVLILFNQIWIVITIFRLIPNQIWIVITLFRLILIQIWFDLTKFGRAIFPADYNS